MIEASINTRNRNAMQRAHEERGLAMKAAWRWLFPSKNAR